jgi:hypothetical protein
MAKRTKKLTLSLPVQFTAAELAERETALVEATLEYDRIEAEKKIAAKQFSEALKGLRREGSSLARQIQRGGQDAPVECIVTFHDPEPGFKSIMRGDTGEVLRQEPMTDEEKQENLFDDRDDVEFLKTLYAQPGEEQNQPQGPSPDTAAQDDNLLDAAERAWQAHERRGESPGAVPFPPPRMPDADPPDAESGA